MDSGGGPVAVVAAHLVLETLGSVCSCFANAEVEVAALHEDGVGQREEGAKVRKVASPA